MKMAGIEPEDALFVGDSRNDVLAAKAAGVRCAALTYGYKPRPADRRGSAHPGHRQPARPAALRRPGR